MTSDHLVFVQYGDYREAVERFERGGNDNYYGQRQSVEFVASLVSSSRRVTVVCVATTPYPAIQLSNGVAAIGLRLYAGTSMQEMCRQVIALAPDHLVIGAPIAELWQAGLSRGSAVLLFLADSFSTRGLKNWWRNQRLERLARHRSFRFIANHNVNASRTLLSIGFPADRIVPWDWPPVVRPQEHPVKAAPGKFPFRLLFVGAVVAEKGVGDAIEAVAILRAQGKDVTLTIAGSGNVPEFEAQSARMALGNAIKFLGRVPHDRVFSEMLAHDAVLVPSHHEYAEGLPMTIYEAFASRTPLIASNHPMFAGKVRDGESGLVCLAGKPAHLSSTVARLIDEPGLYERLSTSSLKAWEALQCITTSGEVISRFLGDVNDDPAWLRTRSLASGAYDDR